MSQLNEHGRLNLQLCLNHLPHDYDALIKSSKISLFYIMLFITIFIISSLAALLIIIVSLLTCLLVIKNRKEVYAINKFRNHQKDATNMNTDLDNMILFTVRFSMTYAGKFSRHASSFLQQRVIIFKVANSFFL